MLVKNTMSEIITDIRKLVTRPRGKTAAEAREDFRKYLQDTHKIDSAESVEGELFMGNLRKWRSANALLKFMGY